MLDNLYFLFRNACEVDSTIEAPYWANNTGGKTLALLNLYPFEQYIHIETCMSEMTEGLCRSGCRCEQQYRLHRLLAFDPNNECRGKYECRPAGSKKTFSQESSQIGSASLHSASASVMGLRKCSR